MASTIPANQYTVTGGGVDGVVSITSIGGQPQASLTIDGTAATELTVSETARGIEVTGVVSRVPDDRTVSVAALVPVVRLDDGSPLAWAGIAVVTTERQTIGGPSLLTGAVHAYQVRPVGGLASLVQPLAAGPGDYEV